MAKLSKSKTARGPAEWFNGDVWLESIGQALGTSPVSYAAVHFTPGARTAWHAHSLGQTLYVLEGEGVVQSRGEAAHRVHAGDVVVAPAGEWHWHGAVPERFMTHLALTEGDATWGDHLADAEYDKAVESR